MDTSNPVLELISIAHEADTLHRRELRQLMHLAREAREYYYSHVDGNGEEYKRARGENQTHKEYLSVPAVAELSKPDEGEARAEKAERLLAELNKSTIGVLIALQEKEAQAEALAQVCDWLEKFLEEHYNDFAGKDRPAVQAMISHIRTTTASYRSGNPPRKSVPLAMFEEFAKELLDMDPGAPWLLNIGLLAKKVATPHGLEVTE